MLVLTRSDAHASKCAKLGLSFEHEYPAEHAEYVAANEEYNQNESTLAELYKERAREEEASFNEERARE